MNHAFAVVFWNNDTCKVKMDVFFDANEDGAKRSFNNCYRHGNYKILSVVQLPDKDEG